MKNIHTKALMYSGTLFLIILSVLAIATTSFVVNGSQSYDENTISVTGMSEVSSAPDVANFSFTVKDTSETSEEAQSVINEQMSKILDGFIDLAIEEKDIKTESYTIYPKYEWVKVADDEIKTAISGEIYIPDPDNRKRVQIGYDVSQNVSLTVRNLENVPAILTLLAENEVENLNGPNFEIDDPEGLKEQARLEAIADAKAKANKLAKELDVKLGKIVSFYEDSYYPEPYYRNGMMTKAVSFDMAEEESFAPELPVGENNITGSVTITYKIK